MMILFPAIDIRNGKCVRLIQGDYKQEKIYSDSPVEMAQRWESEQAQYLHIVDLDGAKSGEASNKASLAAIVKQSSIPIQIGGGIRSMKEIEEYLDAGVDRVILGTAAINDGEFLTKAVKQYGSKIAVSIDARNGYVATDGWTATSTVKAADFVKKLEQLGVETIIYTDILKDGMLQGPNFNELQAIQDAANMNVIASGGVTSEQDVQTLSEMNLYGAIIGKALYDGTTSLASLLEVEQHAR